MIVARASTRVGRSIDQVYHFVVVDFAKNYQRWAPEVQRLELLTDGPIRVGSRARQIRVDQGRKSDTCFQVTALQPQSRVCFAESTRQFQVEYRMQPREAATELSFEFRLQRVELYMRPFEKLIRIAIQDGTEKTVRNIKRLVENDASSALSEQPTR